MTCNLVTSLYYPLCLVYITYLCQVFKCIAECPSDILIVASTMENTGTSQSQQKVLQIIQLLNLFLTILTLYFPMKNVFPFHDNMNRKKSE